MCNPTLALAIGAQVAGKVIQDRAYKKADNARNTAIDNNNNKITNLNAEAKVGIDKSKDMFQDDAFNAGNEASQSKFAALYNDKINTPNYAMPKIGNAPAIVEEAMTNEMMKAAAYNKQQLSSFR